MVVNKQSREEDFMGELIGQIADLREYIASGKCETFDKYCASAGEYRALSEMEQRLEEFFATDEDDDE